MARRTGPSGIHSGPRTATILMADVVGSNDLAATIGTSAQSDLVRSYVKRFRRATRDYHGRHRLL
jgi:class 3 adenylate cyclase